MPTLHAVAALRAQRGLVRATDVLSEPRTPRGAAVRAADSRGDTGGAARYTPVLMRITKEEVRTTAAMARLALTPAEQDQLALELSRILDYAALLQEVDVSGVAATTHAVPLPCALRPDQIGPHLSTEEALRAAPAHQDGFFVVPAVFAPSKRPDEA